MTSLEDYIMKIRNISLNIPEMSKAEHKIGLLMGLKREVRLEVMESVNSTF